MPAYHSSADGPTLEGYWEQAMRAENLGSVGIVSLAVVVCRVGGGSGDVLAELIPTGQCQQRLGRKLTFTATSAHTSAIQEILPRNVYNE